MLREVITLMCSLIWDCFGARTILMAATQGLCCVGFYVLNAEGTGVWVQGTGRMGANSH